MRGNKCASTPAPDLLQSMNITVNIPLKVRHPPAPVDEEQSDGQEYLQDGPSEVAPVTNVTESERLKNMSKS